MIVSFLVTLLFFPFGYALVPVKTVQLGESVSFNCALPSTEVKQRDIHWYKQRPGDTLRLILKVKVRQQKPRTPEFEPEFSDSRWEENNDKKFSRLTILKTTYNDDGLYHCALIAWMGSIEWSGTYRIVIGNAERISDYTIVQEPTVSSPVRLGDTATLQCSVFFDSMNIACSEELSVFWLQTVSNKIYPTAIYTAGNRRDECQNGSETEKSCMFQFSKAVNSSDTGIIYCAVASCGKILFGNGTKLEVVDNTNFEFTTLMTVVACLVFSMILNIFICYRTSRAVKKQPRGMENTTYQEPQHNLRQRMPEPTDGGKKNDTAIHFSKRKERRGGKKKNMETQECLYSQIKI